MRDYLSFFWRMSTRLMILLLELFTFIFRLFRFGGPKKPQPKPYQAHFGSTKKLLSPWHRGFRLTGKESISVHNSFQNAMIIGGTGVGKSSVVLIPSLLTMQGSFVVHDPSGELKRTTARALEKQGYTVKTLNFANPTQSCGFNPLARITSAAEVNKVAALIVRTSLGGNGDPFWDLQAVNLLSMLIQIVMASPNHRATLGVVRELLAEVARDPNSLGSIVASLENRQLLNEYEAFLALDAKVKLGVVATVMSALQVFSDSQVVAATSHDTISFDTLRTRRTALFIQNPIADQAYYSVLTAIFLEQLFASLLKKLPKSDLDHHVFCLIDEASSLYIPSLSVVIANVRKYRVGILLALQDFSQLAERYNHHDAETIRSNCFAKLYFTGQSLATSRELEEQLGRYQYPDQNGKTVVRPLLTNDEIRTLPKNQALLLLGHHRPLLVKLKPFYKQLRMNFVLRS